MWKWIVLALVILVLYDCNKQDSLTARTDRYSYPNSSKNSTRTFGNYGCTFDCSGHQAGYNWAELNSIDDEDDCVANSNSFIEGCKQYVEENN